MTAYIVDHSAWSKALHSAPARRRLDAITTHHVIMTCPPQVLEYCHSARNGKDHGRLRLEVSEHAEILNHPSNDEVLVIQERLWVHGRVRDAGPVDILIAAYAIANGAVVLSADRDYDAISQVIPGFRHEYLSAA